MTITIINQARMTSQRLPGKVLREVLGKPLLAYQIERLQKVALADRIMTATTTNPEDDPIVALSERLGVPVFRGSEADVLGRYYGAAQSSGADVVVRVTADCPLNDPAVIDAVIRYYLDHQPVDFVSTALQPTFPKGIGAAAFSFRCLEEAHREASDPAEREHVTPFLYWRPERYRLGCLTHDTDCSQNRWTVDTIEDFELIRRIIETLYPHHADFGWQDVLALLHKNPAWIQINASVPQKLIYRPVVKASTARS